jgi:hypothetical protein
MIGQEVAVELGIHRAEREERLGDGGWRHL